MCHGMGLTASAVGERIALVWSLSQLLRELDLTSLECPPHMSDVLPMQMQARCIRCHRRRCNSAYRPAARELTAAASGSTSDPARPTPRHVGCIHCHQRRPRMSSLQLQVGRHQSQRDRHRSCSHVSRERRWRAHRTRLVSEPASTRTRPHLAQRALRCHSSHNHDA